jgi:GNAT superfamily N-acetyltransferase
MSKHRLAIARFILGLPRPSKAANFRRLRKLGEKVESFIIREAISSDIPALSALHVKTWSETYWNVKHPPAYEVREHQWKEQFNVTDRSWFCFVIENSRGQLVGFTRGRINNDSKYPGELNKIYLLREYQRLGLGHRLMGHVARRFISMGITAMAAYVDPRNPSCYFFETLEAKWLIEKDGRPNHNWYCWQDLQRLASICPVE